MYLITHYGHNLGESFFNALYLTENEDEAKSKFKEYKNEIELRKKEFEKVDDDDAEFEDFSEFIRMFDDSYYWSDTRVERRAIDSAYYEVWRIEKIEKNKRKMMINLIGKDKI